MPKVHQFKIETLTDNVVASCNGILINCKTMQALKKAQFGNRILDDDSKVFDFNAWDNVNWTPDLIAEAENLVKNNTKDIIPATLANKYEVNAVNYWNSFYNKHQNRFFKDRNWLFTEFPDLYDASKILEVGCGVGNIVFPILNSAPKILKIYCCDFSPVAVDFIQSHPNYDKQRCCPFLWDITQETVLPFEAESIQFIILVFVLSSLCPAKMGKAMKNLVACLQPGGCIYFRDYGLYDMAQLRFKNGHCLGEQFYLKGDGTRVYFFTTGKEEKIFFNKHNYLCHIDEIRALFSSVGLKEIFLMMDKRLQLNRRKQLRMYRVWIQAKFMKLIKSDP